MPPFGPIAKPDPLAKYESEQGFMLCYNTSHNGQVASTAIKDARTVSIESVERPDENFFLFLDEAGNFLAIAPVREVMCVLKLETVGPASADQPK